MNFPYQAMLAETVSFHGHHSDLGEAYYARPLGPGPFPGVVIIHHMPGWDEWIKEVPRKFAHHGFLSIAPHLYFREGPGGMALAPDQRLPIVREQQAPPRTSQEVALGQY